MRSNLNTSRLLSAWNTSGLSLGGKIKIETDAGDFAAIVSQMICAVDIRPNPNPVLHHLVSD